VIAIGFEPSLPGEVTFTGELVDRAVYFYDQLALDAAEIQNEALNRMLAAEVQPIDLVAAQGGPQPPLGGRRLAAKPARRLLDCL